MTTAASGGAPAPNPETVTALGLEINTGHVSCRVVDLTGRIVHEHHEAGQYAHSDPGHALEHLATVGRRAIDALPDPRGLVAINVALPGIVSHDRSVLLRAPNLGWENIAMRDALAQAGLPQVGGVAFDIANGADFAALAVLYEAPGRKGPLESFLYVAGDAGIGACPVMRGEVMQGAHGWSGEIGHMCIDQDGPLCGCGNMGCLESIAGPQALLAHTGAADWETLLASLDRPVVQQQLRRAARALGIGLSNALNLLDLSVAVIGGRLADIVHAVQPVIERELRRRVLSAHFDDPKVLTPKLGEYPATLGAAYAGLNAYLARNA